jgi:hypothetical protein
MEQEGRVSGIRTELTKAQDVVQANVTKDLERQQVGAVGWALS